MTKVVTLKNSYQTTLLDNGPLPDEFRDAHGQRWVWKNLVTKKAEPTSALARAMKYRIDLGSLQAWNEVGCAGLDSEKLELQRMRVRGGKGPGRLYVRIADLDRIQRFKIAEHPTVQQPWILYKDAVKIVPHTVLFRFGSNRASSPQIHPALGRSIKFDFRHVSTKGRVVEQILYWQPDLKKIVEYQPPRDIWVTAAKALTEYPPVSDNDIRKAERSGRLHAEVFALPPEQYRGTFIKHFLRSEITGLRTQKEQRNRLRPESPNRVHVDPDGTRWLPLGEVRKAIPSLRNGANFRLKDWSVECLHLDGKPLLMKRVSMEIFRSKFGGTVRVWLESQVLQIARKLRGEPDLIKANIENPDIHAKLDGLHAKHDELLGIGGCQSTTPEGTGAMVSTQRAVVVSTGNGGSTTVFLPTENPANPMALCTAGTTVFPECKAAAVEYFQTGVLDPKCSRTGATRTFDTLMPPTMGHQ